MLRSEYYENYTGPHLVKCMVDNIDYTPQMLVIYGEKNNWQGCLWSYKVIFGPSQDWF